MVNASRSGSTTSRYSPFQRISRRPGPTSMVARQAPPLRTSMETLASGTSASPPPNQSAKRSGSVHSRHTRSRGAANTRVMLICGAGSAIGRLVPGRPQACLQALEAGLPEPAVVLQPVHGVPERRRLEPRGPQLGGAAPGDQPGPLQHLEVLGDGL